MLCMYKKTQNRAFLCPLGLTLLKIPWTYLTMPMSLEDKRENENMDGYLARWKSGHWFRIVTDLCAFFAVVCLAVNRRHK